MQTLVSVNDLLTNLDRSDWVLFDCRYSLADNTTGLKSYLLNHIPNTRYADLNSDLSGPIIPGRTGRHPLPAMDKWIKTVRSWGVENSSQVVVYDDSGGPFAARLWWMFRWIGHQQVAVLDGGWSAWTKKKYPVTQEEPESAPESSFEAGSPLTRTVEAEDLLELVKNNNIRLLDAREVIRFRGDEEPLDAVAGHIPGAMCAPFGENLDKNGFFKPADQLRERFDRTLTGSKDQPVVCYCGSGVTAAHNILAIVHAGLEEPILYSGSWSEWILDPNRPIETG